MPPKQKRGPGQPPKPSSKKRDIIKPLRFNRDEWQKIKKAAKSSSHKHWSKWARNILLLGAVKNDN